MSDVDLDQTKVIEEAKAAGMKVYRGRPNRLLLDLDDEYALFCYEKRFPVVQKILFENAPTQSHMDLREVKRWKSRSGHGWHVLISSNIALEVTARFLLQAILGSDHMRELYSLIRLWDGQEEPSMLFRPPDVSEKKVRPKKYATDDDVPF